MVLLVKYFGINNHSITAKYYLIYVGVQEVALNGQIMLKN